MKHNYLFTGIFLAMILMIPLLLKQCSKDLPVDEDYIFEGGKVLKVNVGGYLITQREKVPDSYNAGY